MREAVQGPDEIAHERIRPLSCEVAVQSDRFLIRRQRLLLPPEVGEAERVVGQRLGEVGVGRVGPLCDKADVMLR